MMMILTLIGLTSGALSAGGTYIANNGLEWWQYLLIACVPPIIGFILDFIKVKFNVKITDKQRDEIVDKSKDFITDIVDDGKINNSHKKEDKNEINRQSKDSN